MSRVKQKALSGPPSQEPLEGGPDSALPFLSNTVAPLARAPTRFWAFPNDTGVALKGYKPVAGVGPILKLLDGRMDGAKPEKSDLQSDAAARQQIFCYDL